MKLYVFQVAWGDRSVEVTCSTHMDAIKAAADQFHVDWRTVVDEMIVTPLREIKRRPSRFG